MSNPFLRDLLIDDSGEADFRFALHCMTCGKRWDVPPIPCSPQAAAEGVMGKTYQCERIWALDEAACQADAHFGQCPICGKIVCLDCIVAYQKLAMCRSCLSVLKRRLEK